MFGPLGMADYAFKLSTAMRAGVAKFPQCGDNGKLVPQIELEIPKDPEFETSG